MKGLGIILLILLVLLFMTMERGGIDEIKNNPLQSTVESGKTIIEAGKDITVEIKEVIEKNQNQT